MHSFDIIENNSAISLMILRVPVASIKLKGARFRSYSKMFNVSTAGL